MDKQSTTNETRLVKSLRSLHSSGQHSDLTLVVQGVPLEAHKAILALRSSVFSDLLQCGCSTSGSKTTLHINDMDVDVAKALLAFIYTGSVQDMPQYARPLLKAAYKYKVAGLRQMCDNWLSDHTIVSGMKTDQLTTSEKRSQTPSQDTRNLMMPDGGTVEDISLGIVETTFVWRIEKFSYLHQRTGAPIFSLAFSYRDNEVVLWKLQLFPRGNSTATKDYISLFLNLVDSYKYPVMAKYQLAVLDNNSNKINLKSSGGVPKRFQQTLSSHGFHRFIKRSDLMQEKNGLIDNDTVTIFCRINAVTNRQRQVTST